MCLASVLLAVAILGMFAGTAWAQPEPVVPSTQGSGFGGVIGTIAGWLTGGLTQTTLMMWQGLLLIIEMLASALLFIAGFFLDNIFYYNVVLNPSNMPVVQEGWTIMRDIANSFFILIILWIAFTIIFNVENLGGRKLLVRVILIALLINFSLVFVSVVFGVANSLALPFQSAISGGGKNNDVAGIIIGRVKLQSIFETPSQASLENYRTAPELKSKGCGFGSLAGVSAGEHAVGCILGTETADFASSFVKGFTQGADLFTGNLSRSVSMSMSIIFLLLATLSFIVASITLLTRLVAMVFLSILAPAAFIAAAIPTSKAQQLWNKWLSELFCWAFYAPAFYFLFWLSLRMLEVMTDKLPAASPGNFGSFILAMLPFIVFFAFLWASVKIGKYLGCEGAGMAIDLGKKVGNLALGAATTAATGGASRLATMALKPGGAVSRGLTRAAATPGLRWVGGAYPQRAATRFIGEQQQKIDKQEKSVAAFGKEQLFADYDASFAPERKVAIMRRIAKENWIDDFKKRYGPEGDQKVQKALNLATRYGGQGPILEELPHLATRENVLNLPQDATDQDAIDAVVKRIKDKSDIAAISYSDPRVMRAVWKNLKGPGELEKIARGNFKMYRAMEEFRESESGNRALEDAFAQMDVADETNRPGTALKENLGRYREFVLGKVFREKTPASLRQELGNLNNDVEKLERKLERLATLEKKDVKEENKVKLRIEELRGDVAELSRVIAQKETGREQPPLI